MTISATIAVSDMAQANAELEAAGHGPSNFSVPLRTGSEGATHAGLHSWDDDDFLAVLQSLSVPVRIRNEPGREEANFEAHVHSEALEWSDPTLWFENPVMKDDIRLFDGVEYRSRLDYNVWTPSDYPRGWELVNDPTPEGEWQPDTAYAVDDEVTYEGTSYRCIQAHTSQTGWEPPNVPALWGVVS